MVTYLAGFDLTSISNTLEGVHEATFISGVLSDFLRYAQRVDASTKGAPQAAMSAAESEQKAWKKGRTVVVQDEPSPQLPMGLELKQAQGIKTMVDETKVRTMSGLVVRKTAAEMGKEVRRKLPPYVFERIRF